MAGVREGWRSPRRIVLGPCPCEGCGRLLWWEQDNSGRRWRDSDGAGHRCAKGTVRALQRGAVTGAA